LYIIKENGALVFILTFISMTFLMLFIPMYQNTAQRNLMQLILSYFENLKYEDNSATKNLEADYVKNLFVLPEIIDKVIIFPLNYCDTFIKGRYNFSNINIFELKFTPKKYNSFRGILIKINIYTKENTNGRIVITRIPKYLYSEHLWKELRKFKTNNSLFNKYFDIYYDEIINIENILTTEFMKKMLNIVKLENKLLNDIRVSFEKKHMNIVIPNNSLFLTSWFDFPFFKSLLNLDNYHDIYTKLSLILFIIDTLCTQKEVEENFGEN
jgi:hypothetical protein